MEDLAILNQHGRDFLEPGEFEQRFSRMLQGYYNYLARSVFDLRNAEYWDYQKQGLAKAGHPFNRLRLAKACLVESLDVRKTLKQLLTALRR